MRERFEDIPVLADFFVKHYNRKFKRQIEGLTPEALQLLESHDWPGNVRELRNAVERAMILEDSSYITPASLPMSVSHQPPGASQYHAAAAAAPAGLPAAGPLPDAGMSLEDNEKRLLVQALEKTAGNQTQAARLLRITRDTLRYKMKKFDIR